MAQTTEPKLVRSMWMIHDRQTQLWIGKSGKYGRTSQPAVYWSEGIAKSATPNETLEADGLPRYIPCEVMLQNEMYI